MNICAAPLVLSMRRPLVTARGTAPASLDTTLVRVGAWGRVGWGLARVSLAEPVTREAFDALADRLSALGAPSLDDALDVAEDLLSERRACLAGVDMALHDAFTRARGVSLADYAGFSAPVPDTPATLGDGSPLELAVEVRSLVRWKTLKLKVSPRTPASAIRSVREAFDGDIVLDANGSLSEDAATALLEDVRACGVRAIEQPLAPRHLEASARLRARTGIPVWLDEDIETPSDVVRAAGFADGVVVKIGKCGGIRGALRCMRTAREHGLAVSVGCKAESALAVTAAAQLARGADVADLDGALWIANDPFEGLRVLDGRVTIPSSPGIGVRRSRAPVTSPFNAVTPP